MKKLILILLVMIPFWVPAQKKDSLLINVIPPVGPGESIYMLDGKVISKAKASLIKSNDIVKVAVMKGSEIAGAYGDKTKNGVVQMTSKKSFAPPANNFLVTPNSIVYLDDKKITNEEAEKLNPDDMIESGLARYPQGVLKDGYGNKVVMNLVSKEFAKKSYQEKFSKFCLEYKNYLDQRNGDDTAITYDLAGLIIKNNYPRKLVDLYQFSADKIKAVCFDEHTAAEGPALTIQMIY